MTGLEPKAHRLVGLARSGDEPSAAQLLSLHGAIAAGIAAEAVAVPSASAAGAKAASAGVLMKGLVVASAIATGAAGFFALHGPDPEPVVVVRAPSARPAPTALAAAAPEASPAPAPEEAPAQSARAVKPLPPGLRLQDEAALLAEVQGALRSGKANFALAKLESYDRRFPSGMLRAEADAARVFALCEVGRTEKARAAAQRFVQRYPSSPAAARVQAACK